MEEIELFAFCNIQSQVAFVLKRNGFMEIVRRFVSKANRNIQIYDGDVKECANSLRVVPDAFFLDEKDKTLFVYEIEDSSPLSWNKLCKYYELDEELFSAGGWQLHLFVTDRYGLNLRRLLVESVELVFAMVQ